MVIKRRGRRNNISNRDEKDPLLPVFLAEYKKWDESMIYTHEDMKILSGSTLLCSGNAKCNIFESY
jgi:hypothetical protein